MMDPGSAAASGDSQDGSSAEDNHPPINETFDPAETPSNEPSEWEIQEALSLAWASDDSSDLAGNIEHFNRLAITLHRANRNYRLFNLTNNERRRELSTMVHERLNNERLSRILRVPMSDGGAFELFRAVRTEMLWQITIYGDPGGIQNLISLLDNGGPTGNTIVVSPADSRREVMRATRRALGYITRLPDRSLNERSQPGIIARRVAGSPVAPALANVPVSLGATSQAIVPRYTCRTPSHLADTWTNFREQSEKKHIRQEIEATSTAKLAPPLSETELIQSLVLQFLTHDGYVETAKAFSEEVHAEKKALSLDPNAAVNGFEVKEDEDAGHRQR